MSMDAHSHDLPISLESAPSAEDVSLVQEGLRGYNLLFAPDTDHQTLTLFVRAADGSILGGLLGETYWGWLYISILWLDESIRNQGYGSRLLKMAEEEAIRRGCHAVHLDTMSFQAQSFYERHGYSVYGVLNDIPLGHSRISLKKALI